MRPWTNLGLAAVYYAAAKLGLSLSLIHPSATAVWPPSGIALAALILMGNGAWPGIALGAFLANLSINLSSGAAPLSLSVAAAAGIAAGNTLEALLGAFLVQRFAGGAGAFRSASTVYKSPARPAMLSTAASATLGVASLCLCGLARWPDFSAVWLTWWLGDAAGVLLVAPALLAWSQERAPLRRAELWEGALLSAALVLAGLIAFGGWFPTDEKGYPLEFLCLPPLLWAAFRFRQPGTASLLLILAGLAVWGTIRGFGPFFRDDPNESLLLLQAFLGTLAVAFNALAAVVAEGRRHEQSLSRAQASLERRVGERTAELAAANAALDQQAAELARSNQELQAFASVASHDLQEPLRKIMAFGDLLESRLGPKIDAESKNFLERMTGTAGRMAKLVDDLLILSKVVAQARPFERVDPNAMLAETLLDMEARLAQTGGRVEVGPLPPLRADPAQIRRLFQNLISNALKFHRPDVPPRVAVSGRDRGDGFVEIAFSDNGIGFEEEHRQRIFKPFHRLNSRAQYPGNGIGLAICEKIVLRHGGAISAQSTPGQGSVFTVTLPTPYGKDAGEGGSNDENQASRRQAADHHGGR